MDCTLSGMMFSSACPALAGSVEPLYEARADRGVKHRFDLVASKVIFDRLKDRRNKRLLVLFVSKNRKIHDFQAVK